MSISNTLPKGEVDNRIDTSSGADDTRYAVEIGIFDVPEDGIQPFSQFPEGYMDNYRSEIYFGAGAGIYFLTADDMDKIVCDPEAKIVIGPISYYDYLYRAELSDISAEFTSPGTAGDPGNGILFEPTEDNVLWVEDDKISDFSEEARLFRNDVCYNSAFFKEEMEWGEIYIDNSIKALMDNAGDKRIAVDICMEINNSGDGETAVTDMFVNLPEGYAETYGIKKGSSMYEYILFMTVDEINKLYCDPMSKIVLAPISYEMLFNCG